MALAASLLALTTVGGLSFSYIARQRQIHLAGQQRLLGRAATLLDQARHAPEDPVRWRTALAAVEQIEQDPGGIAADTRVQSAHLKADAASGLRDAEADAALLHALVDARANQQDAGAEGTDEAYAEAFRDADLDLEVLSAAEAAERLKRRPTAVVVELAAYLDHWLSVRVEARRPQDARRKLLEVARAADADEYRGQLRSLLSAGQLSTQAAHLESLAREPKAAGLPAPTAVLLGLALEGAGAQRAAVSLLRRAVARHPDDVWINFSLAEATERLVPRPREEAVRYLTAARALRPETAHRLAHVLDELGRDAEAEATFRDLVERKGDDPRHLACFGGWLKKHGRASEASPILDRAVAAARAALMLKSDVAGNHFALGLALRIQGEPAEAETVHRTANEHKPDGAPAHDGLGNALWAEGKMDEAAAEYRSAIRLRPDYKPARYGLALALRGRRKFHDAAAEYRGAIQLWPGFSEAYAGLGALLCDDMHEYAEAEKSLRTAIRLRPDSAYAHDWLGVALRHQGKLDEAVAECREAIRLEPRNPYAHSNLGVVLQGQGKRDDAITEHRTAIRLKPDYALAHYNLGIALKDQGKVDDAITAYRTAIRLKPDDSHTHNNLGLVLMEQGQPDEAIVEFREAIRLEPGNASAYNNLGAALKDQGKLDDAIIAHRTAIRLKPDYAFAHNNLGNALMDQGKLVGAITEYRTAIRLKPDSAEAHSNLGSALTDQHKLVDAITECREAIRIKPDYAFAHNNLGYALINQGKVDDAITAYRTAIRLKPDYVEAHINLGAALISQGKVDDAITEFRTAIRLKPDSVDAHNNFGVALINQGKFDDAIAEDREAMRLKPDSWSCHNNLAWALVLRRNRPLSEYDEGLRHAREAVHLLANDVTNNTLALAEYRMGHWDESLAAGDKSIALGKGGNANDWFFQAMVRGHKGDKGQARKWFDRAVAWTRENDPKNKELLQFWSEAAEVLGQPGPDGHGETAQAIPDNPFAP
jgi:tetratricopeptide (TPR) repeat protein